VLDALAGPQYERTLSPDGRLLTLRPAGGWWRRVQPHPSRIVCAVVPGEHETLLGIDSRFSLRYALVCFAMTAVAAVLLVAAFLNMGPQTPLRANVAYGLFALTGVIVLMQGRMYAAAGALEVTLLAEAVRRAAEHAGATFDQERETSPRAFRIAVLYVAYVAALLVAVVASDVRVVRIGSVAAAAWMMMMLLFCATLVALLLSSRRDRGFLRRSVAAVPPLGLVVVFLLFILALVPSLVAARSGSAAYVRRTLELYDGPGLIVMSEPLVYARAGGILTATVAAFGLLVAAGGFVYVCRIAYTLLPDYLTLAASEGLGKVARGAQAFRGRFRLLMIVLWILAGSMTLGAAVVCAWTFAAVASGRSAPGVDAVGAFMAIAFRVRLTTGDLLSRIAHGSIAFMGMFLWSLQPLAMLWTEWRSRVALRTWRVRSGRAVDAMQRIAERGRAAQLPVAVEPSPVPFAFATGTHVRLSTRAVELLDDAMLEAVLAHELAHHLMGHCRKDRILRWLARLAMVGDSLARIAQDTEAQEFAADRAAVARFGVEPEVLRRAIVLMHHVAAAHAPLVVAGGAPFVADRLERVLPRHEFIAAPFRTQMRLGWRALVAFYLCAGGRAYWHPDTSSRRAVLRTMIYVDTP
jgi:Peptidase family M48